jgi:predicted GNAT family N-acyltransferase
MAAELGPAETLAGLDALARALIARTSQVRFDVASTAAEQRAVFALRYRTVVEEGWAPPTTYPDGLEHDTFDASALQIAGWDGATLVAAARLVFPQPGRPLPTEAEFELRVQPLGAVVDVGRAIVAREYRSKEHTLFGALLARCWLAVRERGYQDLCGAASGWRLERYRQFGLPLRVLGPARVYWGDERYPVGLAGLEFGRFALSASALSRFGLVSRISSSTPVGPQVQ